MRRPPALTGRPQQRGTAGGEVGRRVASGGGAGGAGGGAEEGSRAEPGFSSSSEPTESVTMTK
ncbi:hypothetical protein [Micromonospora purpureochromogenes]|uniref:hypothetical protein n=1 Tax=Micromonospora purpureochromogenes TaxID=47872 RepID=UPI000B5AF423|nr:hypothetical protein [Micromonospora purpureochromogenes]